MRVVLDGCPVVSLRSTTGYRLGNLRFLVREGKQILKVFGGCQGCIHPFLGNLFAPISNGVGRRVDCDRLFLELTISLRMIPNTHWAVRHRPQPPATALRSGEPLPIYPTAKRLSSTSRWSQCDCLSRMLLRSLRAKQPHGSS